MWQVIVVEKNEWKMICSSSSEDEEEEDIPDYNTPGNKLQVPNGSAPR